MPAVAHAPHQKGDFLVDYEEKVFEDVKAKPGEKALVTFHTVAFEGSIGLVNMLQATRLQRKGFENKIEWLITLLITRRSLQQFEAFRTCWTLGARFLTPCS